ncbi:MAG: hypothetical protein AAFW46_13705 [Pseudomonadota bacterium]
MRALAPTIAPTIAPTRASMIAALALGLLALAPLGSSAAAEPDRTAARAAISELALEERAAFVDGAFEVLKRTRRPAAARDLSTAIEAAWSVAPNAEAQALRDRAAAALAADELEAARRALDELLAAAPGFADAWRLSAELRARERDGAGALADSEAALTLEPRDWRALLLRAEIFERQDRSGFAEAARSAARAANPWASELRPTAPTAPTAPGAPGADRPPIEL